MPITVTHEDGQDTAQIDLTLTDDIGPSKSGKVRMVAKGQGTLLRADGKAVVVQITAYVSNNAQSF